MEKKTKMEKIRNENEKKLMKTFKKNEIYNLKFIFYVIFVWIRAWLIPHQYINVCSYKQ